MPELKVSSPAVTSTSLRIIASFLVIAGLYFASSVITPLILAVFIAFVLDPAVHRLERMRIPRWIGSLGMVLVGLGAVYLVFYVLSLRAMSLAAELPRLEARLRDMAAHIEAPIERFTAGLLAPSPSDTGVTTVRLEGQSSWERSLWGGIDSIFAFTVTVMLIPFLVFFMLTLKDHLWAATLNLFPVESRQEAEDVIKSIGSMVRQYVVGNLLVALVSCLFLTPIFGLIGLPYALVLGPVAAVLNLVPYMGVALAMLPPLIVGLVAFNTAAPFIALAVTVAVVHLVAVNVLTPRLVGRRVKLNALSVTLAMMFWGWMWGMMGVLLSIPITAALKAVCDNVGSLRPYGRWLGES